MRVIDVILFRSVAPVLRRVMRWGIGLSLLAVVAAIALVALRGPMGWNRQDWARVGPLVLGLLPMCVIMPAGFWRSRVIRRDWRRSGGRLCLHCGYDVSALDAAGTCPECGGAYDIDADLVVWKESGLERPATPSRHS